MDIEENFRKANKLICPKCNEELKKSNIDYRQAGVWCTCKDCSKSFDIPVTAHFCRDCHTTSTFEDAVIKDVYAYNLKDEVREEATSGWFIVPSIREILQENGYEVESPAFLKGKSGANHMFDVVAYKGNVERKVTVIDLASSTEKIVPEQPVIALFAKIYDVSPDSAYLIAIPKMSENGKKMAKLYDIKVVEVKDRKEVIQALASVMLKK